ncbi:hypothetical protein SAMN04488101_101849 [Pedobacter nyackensis]|uniref:Uncharacterized protein n=1 Tax=Pedobacter nyackensis TaxID=475255 RepID=A0A1W2AQI9_9SPHI|nr:hypothetical protein SAMN04488101_101849 [Pedobacter nyackensis]
MKINMDSYLNFTKSLIKPKSARKWFEKHPVRSTKAGKHVSTSFAHFFLPSNQLEITQIIGVYYTSILSVDTMFISASNASDG